VERSTAIAVGFLVEKFDLFLALAAPFLAGRTPSLMGPKFGNIAALALIILDSWHGDDRDRSHSLPDNREDYRQRSADRGLGARVDLALAALLVLLGLLSVRPSLARPRRKTLTLAGTSAASIEDDGPMRVGSRRAPKD
jgi:hypothetical protein